VQLQASFLHSQHSQHSIDHPKLTNHNHPTVRLLG
jgi:hypothetical protein